MSDKKCQKCGSFNTVAKPATYKEKVNAVLIKSGKSTAIPFALIYAFFIEMDTYKCQDCDNLWYLNCE